MKGRLLCAAAMLLVLVAGGCSKKQDGDGTAGSAQGGSAQDAAQKGKPDKSTEGGAQASDVVAIAPADQAKAGIRIDFVSVESVPRSVSVAGQVVVDEQHTSHIGTLADGRVMSVSVLPGAPVRRGEVLGTLHSHMVHETVGALMQAYAAVDRQRGAVSFAQLAQQRYHHLYSIQAASLEESQRSDQDLLAAQKMLVDAEASVHMEREHLSELLQVPPASLNPEDLYNRELVPIRSPIDGVLLARNVTVGQVVETGFDAFDVSNLATVWVTASLNQQDLGLVQVGAPVEVTASGFPDQVFAGSVGSVGDMLDETTRTVPVRVVVPNPARKLRPGMFATARLGERATRDAVFVPEDSLQEINGMTVVFVTADGKTFHGRTVRLGTRTRGRAEVEQGLRPGDRIVVSGAFMVKSEMLKGTMGEG